jgi:large subunit ribosomal protein L25
VKFEIDAQARAGFGRAENRKLRRDGRVPAIVYGGGADPSPITLERNSLVRQLGLEAFFTSILNLKVGGQIQPVVVKEVQRHPARSFVIHVDFQRVVADEEITLTVPIHFVGEANAIGVKEQGGVIEHALTDVEISCLPANLPEYLELDVAGLGLNEILHLSDIKYPEGVASTQLAHGHDSPVVAIHPPRREEAEEPVEAPSEVPVAAPEASKDEEPAD